MGMPNRRFVVGSLLLAAGLLMGGLAHAAEKKAPAAPRGLALESLPPAVQATVREQTKGAVIHAISKEVENGKTVYEIETHLDGRSRDMIVAGDGTLMVVEHQMVLDSLAAPVRETLLKAAGKGKILLVESVTLKDSLAYYEAQVTTAGKHSEIKVDPSGRLVPAPKKK